MMELTQFIQQDMKNFLESMSSSKSHQSKGGVAEISALLHASSKKKKTSSEPQRLQGPVIIEQTTPAPPTPEPRSQTTARRPQNNRPQNPAPSTADSRTQLPEHSTQTTEQQTTDHSTQNPAQPTPAPRTQHSRPHRSPHPAQQTTEPSTADHRPQHPAPSTADPHSQTTEQQNPVTRSRSSLPDIDSAHSSQDISDDSNNNSFSQPENTTTQHNKTSSLTDDLFSTSTTSTPAPKNKVSQSNVSEESHLSHRKNSAHNLPDQDQMLSTSFPQPKTRREEVYVLFDLYEILSRIQHLLNNDHYVASFYEYKKATDLFKILTHDSIERRSIQYKLEKISRELKTHLVNRKKVEHIIDEEEQTRTLPLRDKNSSHYQRELDKAINALQKGNKLDGLQTLVLLSKQHPDDITVQTYLQKALEQ
ncbi:MAG: hypothetical protein ACQESC_03225 [Nanobdellota archaeon]